MSTLLHLVGYPVAVGVLARWRAVVRERRLPWLVAHHAAVGAIVAGWWLRGHRVGAGLNGAWMAVATAWFLRGGPSAR